MADTDHMPALIVLRPGDRVLVTLVDDPESDLANTFADALHESFPGVEFVIMGGVAGLAVMTGAQPSPQMMKRIG